MSHVTEVWEHTKNLPGTGFQTNKRKYFSQAAQRKAEELVLQDAGDTRAVEGFRKGHPGLLNVGLVTEPVLGAGPGRVLGEYCSLLAVVPLFGSASATSRCQLHLGNSLVLQTKQATAVSSVFPAFPVSAIKS